MLDEENKTPQTVDDFLSEEPKEKKDAKVKHLGTKVNKEMVRGICDRAGVEYTENGAEMFRRFSAKAGVLDLLPEKKKQVETESDTIFVNLGVPFEDAKKYKEALGLKDTATGLETVKALMKKAISNK